MVVQAPDPLPCALFLILGFFLPLCFHVLWLKSPVSRPFAIPLDGRRTFRGQRIFGENKMLRGIMVLPLASAASFSILSAHRSAVPEYLLRGMWNLGDLQYAALGFLSGLALMLAELPNSFFKRQLGVRPGETHPRPLLRVCCMLLDRMDSVLGALIVLSLLLPVLPSTWLWTLLLGSGTHAFFSFLLYSLKMKARPL